jgi:hypothetical protein
MKLNCIENIGNKVELTSDEGEAIITIYSPEMKCDVVVVLSIEDTAKFKAKAVQL